MKKLFKISLLTMALALPTLAFAEGEDDFGTWYEVDVVKDLPHKLSLGLDGELRMQDNSSRVDRMSLGLNLGYKLNKYLKFGACYQFLEYYTPAKTKDHYKTEDDGSYTTDIDGNTIWNGYKLTEKYWTPKHRLSLDVTGTVKLNKWLRLLLRERYQFTHAADKTVDTEKHRYDTSKDGTGHYIIDQTEEKDGYPEYGTETKEGGNSHYLRSRLKLEVDKKHWDWSPFISVEMHNCINEGWHLHKLRTCIGTTYKINSHNDLSLSYVLTCQFNTQPHERIHVIAVGYSYDF